MELLKTTALFLACAGLAVSLGSVQAAPPVDLTDEMALEPPKPKRKVIRESDIVFVDNQKNAGAVTHLTQTLFTVTGRSAPGREGKALVVLNKNQSVRILKDSKDKRWQAVEIVDTKRKVWLPKNSIKPLPKPVIEKKDDANDDGDG